MTKKRFAISFRFTFFAIIVALVVIFVLSRLLLPRDVNVTPPPAFTGIPSTALGIGIMGDSNSDEYRADDSRGGDYAAVTLNWMEQLVLRRGLNFGEWGTWNDSRRSGYEYNWANSGATTRSLLEQGQATGLAKQVAEGKVSIVFLWIGYNDFSLTNGTYEEIYNGSLSDSELQTKIDQIIQNIKTAVETVLEAGPVKMIVVTIPDTGLAPQAVIRFPNPTGRRRFSNTVNQVNAGIEKLAETHDIIVVDANSFAESVIKRVDKLGLLEIGDAKINIFARGDSPYHMQLGDKSGHPGTVASGLIANALFIKPLNDNYGLEIEPLTDQEILMDAGIH